MNSLEIWIGLRNMIIRDMHKKYVSIIRAVKNSRLYYNLLLTLKKPLISLCCLFPRFKTSRLCLAHLLFFLKEFDEAAVNYEVILQSSSSTYVSVRLAACYLHLNKMQEFISLATDNLTNENLSVKHLVTINKALMKSKLLGSNSPRDFDIDGFLSEIAKNEHFINHLNEALVNEHKQNLINLIRNYVISQKAHFHYVTNNSLKDIRNKNENERYVDNNGDFLTKNKSNWTNYRNTPKYISGLYEEDGNYTISDYYEIYPPQIRATKIVVPDYNNGKVSVVNGNRNTTDVPPLYENRIIFFGSSTMFGRGSDDRSTIASYFQRLVNHHHKKRYCVENHSSSGNPLLVAINELLQTAVNEGDHVIFFGFQGVDFKDSQFIKNIDLNYLDRGDKFFLDPEHFTHYGNEILANEIYRRIDFDCREIPNDNEEDESISSSFLSYFEFFKYLLYKKGSLSCGENDMEAYLSLLDSNKLDNANELDIGSIAVNCNPITNGHLHLIETSAKKVDFLYLFVIEEDQSFFSFEERYKLVYEATCHMDNVKVLPGGKFICTELTYPDYFDKDDKNEVVADASIEAWYFSEFIAPKLNIKTIFLGDEPNCKITDQYNKKMLEILPNYGIEVDIINRISHGEQVISASVVRKFLNSKRFDKIQPLVPDSTFRFLIKNYS